MITKSLWDHALSCLTVCVDSGASVEEVTLLAQELGRALPDIQDPAAYAQAMDAMLRWIADLEKKEQILREGKAIQLYLT